ncbi:Eukaryotic translation initiation factor 2 subunit 2 [Turdus rufiventris]|nr:Eukaryotic translation initiation factor 2 subunit 2 [Turdus rufiventris]
MSGDEMIFDPTMSKKKKKKKKPFMLDDEGGGDTQTEETQQSETKEVEPEPTEDKDVEADEEDSRKKDTTDDLDDLNFFNQKKKKKKTKKIFDIDEAEEGVKELKIEGDVPETVEPEDDLDIMLGNKKKKKKNVKFPDEDEIMEKDEAFEDEDSKKDDGISFSLQSGPAWAGSERDYTYDELLNRVFNIMREKNPDMVAGEKRKFVMKPPQVVRVGTKKTSFVNFTDICKLLHRQPKHLLAFLLAELGTSGSIDGNNQLVIKGRFQQKQIENVLRRYIKVQARQQGLRFEAVSYQDHAAFAIDGMAAKSSTSEKPVELLVYLVTLQYADVELIVACGVVLERMDWPNPCIPTRRAGTGRTGTIYREWGHWTMEKEGLGEDHTSVRQDKPQGPGAGCACVPEDEMGKKTGLAELLPETEEKRVIFDFWKIKEAI